MNIELRQIPLREIYEGYLDDGEQGVEGYDGKLDIRPPYQREFVYKDKQRDEVIRSVRGGYPIGVMYWARTGPDRFEVIDGQQRTLSLMQFLDNVFSIEIDGWSRNFGNLTDKEKEEILDYEVMVYLCDGTEKEKLDWFKIVNIAGEPLRLQEIRNSVYTGSWLTHAKRYFSKVGGPAHEVGGKYLTGSANRQDYLETALKWITYPDGSTVEDYMSAHQHDKSATELWLYFQDVINWVKATFTTYRKEMKGIDWGRFYHFYKDVEVDPDKLEEEVRRLMMDDEIVKKKGIYEYLLGGDEQVLDLRTFSGAMKWEAYERQKGICPNCKDHFSFEEMEADHIIPWSRGGKTDKDNLQMLCRACNRKKSDK